MIVNSDKIEFFKDVQEAGKVRFIEGAIGVTSSSSNFTITYRIPRKITNIINEICVEHYALKY